ncbi:MAG: hypothetical protein LC795_01865 [Acidobacteria bacterium]|nr:hypothetical protein [Acidobacteriota bacterium]
MSEHTLTSVIEGDLFAVLLYLEGQRIDLSYNGSDTYRSTNTIAVAGPLNVTFVGRGVSPAAWKLTISKGTKKLVEHEDTIGPGNISAFSTNVEIKEDGNASSKSASTKGGAKKSSKKGGS